MRRGVLNFSRHTVQMTKKTGTSALAVGTTQHFSKFHTFNHSSHINNSIIKNNNKYNSRLNNKNSQHLLQVRSFADKIVEVPSMGDSITEGTIISWEKEIGDYADVDDVIVVLETDKVSVDVRAQEAGIVTAHLAEDGDTVEVGAPLFKIDPEGEKPAGSSTPAPTPEPTVAAPVEPETPKPTPAPVAAPKKSTPPATPPSTTEASSSGPDRSETRVKMTRMRITVANRLKSAQNTAAMLTTFQECDMGNLMEMRKQYKEAFEAKHGIKLGFMSAFVQASTKALQEIPAVNGYIDDERKEIVYRNFCDISVAVASPNGLVVPVLRNTEEMSFADVEKKIAEFGSKAREGTLALEDMAGGTFTISNGGVFGSLMGTPIINPPQSAILGMHATKMRPMVVNGEVVPRPMMYLALTYDHRLIDGREAVTFLKSIAQKIEDPRKLLLDL